MFTRRMAAAFFFLPYPQDPFTRATREEMFPHAELILISDMPFLTAQYSTCSNEKKKNKKYTQNNMASIYRFLLLDKQDPEKIIKTRIPIAAVAALEPRVYKSINAF